MLESSLSEYDKCGIIREPSGTGLPNVAPSNIYASKDNDNIVIAANLDPMFKRLCRAMDKEELASDERFITHRARGKNAKKLDEIIGSWAKKYSTKILAQKLEKEGVVFGPINSIADIAQDPHFEAREMIKKFKDSRFGEIKVPGITPKLSKTPGEIKWLGTIEPGQHNKEVYTELGFTEENLTLWRKNGII